MKNMRFILFLCIVTLASWSTIQARVLRETKKEKLEISIRKLIDTGKYCIVVDRVLPLYGISRELTSDYFIKIGNDSIESRLPYFGRAYNIPYGGGNGLMFNAVINDYTANYRKKGRIEIKLVTRSDEDKFTFRITIFPNASVSVNVNSTNRQTISYQGKLIVP